MSREEGCNKGREEQARLRECDPQWRHNQERGLRQGHATQYVLRQTDPDWLANEQVRHEAGRQEQARLRAEDPDWAAKEAERLQAISLLSAEDRYLDPDGDGYNGIRAMGRQPSPHRIDPRGLTPEELELARCRRWGFGDDLERYRKSRDSKNARAKQRAIEKRSAKVAATKP